LFPTYADLFVVAGFISYLFFYLAGLFFFYLRSIKTGTLITMKDILLSVIFAMAGACIVFLIIVNGFVEGKA